VRRQSEHLPDYRHVLDDLTARRLLYPCFCTRAAIQAEVAAAAGAPHAPDGSPVYPGTCRSLPDAERRHRVAAGERHALRLDMAAALAMTGKLTMREEADGVLPCDPAAFGDVVLARKETPTSYHLCVTHDDALQGVTLVTRGQDLKAATQVHRVLQALMGWPEPLYAHHRLLMNRDGQRLAKRDGAVALRQLRTDGQTPERVRALAMTAAAV
jgi:glutamyl-Q tRNA(Asp) synthetase